jgi:predicted lipoprotein
MKKRIKYIIGIAIAGIVAYNSLYFRPLDEKLAEGEVIEFDAQSFVEGIWENDLLAVYDSAVELTMLIDQLIRDPQSTFKREAQALGIGNIGYFKVKGEGTVLSVNENNVLLQVGDKTVEMETEFIFGNAVRDASGLIKVNDYDETSDFNSISEAINDKIRKEVIPDFRARVEEGSKVIFKGALELNKAHLNLTQPEVIPVSIQIIE